MAASNQAEDSVGSRELPRDAAELSERLKQYFVYRTLNDDGLREYLEAAAPSLQNFYQALVALSEDQANVTGKTLDIIRAAVVVCEKNMSSAAEAEERKAVREELRRLVEDARKVHESSMRWYHWALYGASVVATGVLTAAAMNYTTKGNSTKKH